MLIYEQLKYVDASKLDEGDTNISNEDNDNEDDNDDIEAQIKKEVEGMKPAKRANKAPFQIIRMDVQCGMTRTSPTRNARQYSRGNII